MSFTAQIFNAELKKLDQNDFDKWSETFLNTILNVQISNDVNTSEFIRVPLIDRYLKFHQISFTDQNIMLNNNADLLDDRYKLYFYTDVSLSLHFREFAHEYGRKNNGLLILVNEDFLVNVTDTSIYNYVPLDVSKFTTLLQVKNHLKKRIVERLNLVKSDLKLKNTSIDVQFLLPNGQYAMNKDILKIIVEFTF